MKKDYFHQGKRGRGYLIRFLEPECLAQALPLEGFWIGPEVQAFGDTIDEAEARLLAKVEQLEARR